MKSTVLNSRLEWVDYNSGKINFDKLDSTALIAGAKVVCGNNSYIYENGKVVLKDCKVEDYNPKYNYENGNVTSDAKIK